MSTIIYRIQDKDGRGPFRPKISDIWVEERPDHNNLKSLLLDFSYLDFSDIRLLVKPNERSLGSGCTSPEQLKRWFTESEYRTLKKLGYKAVKLIPNRIIAESDTQCLFTSNKPLKKIAKPFKLYE